MNEDTMLNAIKCPIARRTLDEWKQERKIENNFAEDSNYSPIQLQGTKIKNDYALTNHLTK